MSGDGEENGGLPPEREIYNPDVKKVLDTTSDRPHIPPTMTGAEVRARREAMGWKPQQLGDAIGRSERQIYRYETGESPIDGTVALALQHVFGERVTGASQSIRSVPRRSSKGGA